MKRALVIALLVAACSSAEPATDPPPIVRDGGELEIGVTYRYPFYIHCGTEWLIDLNGSVWRTDAPLYDGIGRYSEDLREFFRNPEEQISPELWTHVTLVDDGEIRLTLPDGSRESRYYPTDEIWSGCA